MKIAEHLALTDIIPSLSASSKEEVLDELAARVVARHSGVERRLLVRTLQGREMLGSTGIGDGIAIPHAKLRSAGELMMVFGRSFDGIDFDALDGKPVHLFFLLVAQENSFGVHLKLLARISRILKDPSIRRCLLDAADAATIFHIIREQDSRF